MKIENGKQIPEVGDLWCVKKDNKLVCRILNVIYSEWGQEDQIIIEYANLLEFGLIAPIEFFIHSYKYLGKAKNSLNSFFEVLK